MQAMTDFDMSDDSPIGKLFRSLGPFGFVAVDPSRVNLDDLLAVWRRPGSIVRVVGDPATCIAIYASQDAETLGCVAGWISDAN